MRVLLLACSVLMLPLAAQAQKPPPLGAPDSGPAPRSSPGGKPPPLGADDGTPDTPPNGAPRTRPAQPGRPQSRFGLPFGFGGGDVPSESEQADSSGSGFAVADGRLMTNNHVVAECRRMVARNSKGERVSVRVDVTDTRRDLALLTVQRGFAPPLNFRADPPVRRGETIVTYGFPLSGLLSSGPTLTSGDVSALAGLSNNPVNLQISAAVQPGNSGGPLLDLQGNVVGVVVSKLNAMRIARMTGGDIPQNVNFAVKGTEAQAFLRANNVQIRTASSAGPVKQTYEVGEVADPSTVFLQCYK